jgi:hypothetical protein
MKVIVYCGETVQIKCDKQLHPVSEVVKAVGVLELNKDLVEVYSNSSDFVSTIKYVGKEKNIETEFFLNGKSCGSDIEPIFGDFNRALDMLDKLYTE